MQENDYVKCQNIKVEEDSLPLITAFLGPRCPCIDMWFIGHIEKDTQN